MYDLVLTLVSGWQRAHMPIVKTAMTFGMDIARVMPPRTKMAVGGEGVRRLGPEIVRDLDEDHQRPRSGQPGRTLAGRAGRRDTRR